MDDLYRMWPAVEAAAPNDPTPLLVAADAAQEAKVPNIEYALRWCADRSRRPFRRADLKRPAWYWVRKQGRYASLTAKKLEERRHAVVPRLVFDAGDFGEWAAKFPTSYGAYNWLGMALNTGWRVFRQRAESAAPATPARPAVGTVACASCGISRAWNVELCPVCKSGEVLK